MILKTPAVEHVEDRSIPLKKIKKKTVCLYDFFWPAPTFVVFLEDTKNTQLLLILVKRKKNNKAKQHSLTHLMKNTFVAF